MSATFRSTPEVHDGAGSPDPHFFLDVSTADGTHVIRLAGELDLATCDRLVAASSTGRHSATVIDLGGVTFMDCSGYSALVTARRFLEHDGRALTVRGETGQPARLMGLIARAEIRQPVDG
jgi:anti-anti-sigma factor